MRKRLLIISMLLLAGAAAQAQVGTSETDTELWLKAGAEFKVGEKWEFGVEEQLRFDEQIGAVKNYHTELEIKYSLTDQLDLRVVPRYIRRNDNQGSAQGYEDLFRYQVGVGYKHRWNQLEFKHRALFQNRNELGVSEEEGDIPRHFFRWRTGLEYKIKNWKYDPIFRTEYFKSLNGAKAGTDDAIRFSIGTDRNYDGVGKFGIFYMYETTIDAIDTEIAHIISLRYTYSF